MAHFRDSKILEKISLSFSQDLLKRIFLGLNEARVVSKDTYELWLDSAGQKFGDKLKLAFTFKDFASFK